MKRLGTALLIAALCLGVTACAGGSDPVQTTQAPPVHVDYAAALPLDLSSDTAKAEVTVESFVDGDTVHFRAGADAAPEEVVKARFLAVDTPESTGRVEPFGKKASAFTRQVLSDAESIYIESDSDQWSLDSTGGRYLCWIWYRPAGTDAYRNLNIELLQQGLAQGTNVLGNRYGETCAAALAQAKEEGLNLHSGQPDPDYTYGGPVELTLSDLRRDISAYDGQKVAVSGVVIANSGNNGVYLEAVDTESGIPAGIYVYYGFNLPPQGLEALGVGNECRVVGTVQFYEGSGSWQISGLSYKLMDPEDPENVTMLSQGHNPAYPLTDPQTLLHGDVDGTPYWEAVQATSIALESLTVTQEIPGEKGVTLVCRSGDTSVSLRLPPLVGESLTGRTLDARGIVETYEGNCQIRVFQWENITLY